MSTVQVRLQSRDQKTGVSSTGDTLLSVPPVGDSRYPPYLLPHVLLDRGWVPYSGSGSWTSRRNCPGGTSRRGPSTPSSTGRARGNRIRCSGRVYVPLVEKRGRGGEENRNERGSKEDRDPGVVFGVGWDSRGGRAHGRERDGSRDDTRSPSFSRGVTTPSPSRRRCGPW